MYTRIKKTVRPRRKQDFSFPDGTEPKGKQWIEGGRINPYRRWTGWYFGRWDRARLQREVANWEERGLLIYTPRTYYKVELRHCVKIDGKPTPKTLKTWFIQERDFVENSLREFWRRVAADLTGFGLSDLEISRIKAKIAEVIPMM